MFIHLYSFDLGSLPQGIRTKENRKKITRQKMRQNINTTKHFIRIIRAILLKITNFIVLNEFVVVDTFELMI